MNDIRSLERIVDALASVIKAGPRPLPESDFDPEGKSSKEILAEIEKLDASMDAYVPAALDKVQNCKDLSDAARRDHSTLLTALEEIASLLTDVYTDRDRLEQDASRRRTLLADYECMMRQETGFASTETLLSRMSQLNSESSALRGKLFGVLRYGKRIAALEDESFRLHGLFNEWHKPYKRFVPDISQADEHLKSGVCFVTKNVLAEGYSELATADDKEPEALPKDVLKSLEDDYVANFLKEARARRDKLAAKGRTDSFTIRELDAFSEENLKNAEEVLRLGLRVSRFSRCMAGPEEEQTRLHELSEQLPYDLRNMVEYYCIRDENTSDYHFHNIARIFAQKAGIERRQSLLPSLERARLVLSDAAKGKKEYYLTECADMISRVHKRVTEELSSNLRYISIIDFERWNIFKDNTKVKGILGADALRDFEVYLDRRVWDEILSADDNNREKRIELGYAAIKIDDIRYIPYLLMNFWKEPGHSGEHPFISIHHQPEETEAAKFLTGLSEDKVEELRKRNIPGLMQIVDNVREHPADFLRNNWDHDKGERTRNPIKDKVEEGLAEMCIHYIERGDQKERYFALGLAAQLIFDEDKENSAMMQSMASALGISEHAVPHLSRHIGCFSGKLRNLMRDSRDISSYAPAIDALGAYLGEVDSLVGGKRGQVEFEASILTDSVVGNGDEERRGKAALQYLRALAADRTKELLAGISDQELLDGCLRVMQSIRREYVEEAKDFGEDVGSLLEARVASVEEFLSRSSEMISRSKVGSFLEKAKNDMFAFGQWEYDQDVDAAIAYLGALDDEAVAESSNKLTRFEFNDLKRLAHKVHKLDRRAVSPMVRAAATSSEMNGHIGYMVGKLNLYESFSRDLLSFVCEDEGRAIEFIRNISSMREENFSILESIEAGDADVSSVADALAGIRKAGLLPTNYLVKTLCSEEDKKKTLDSWVAEMSSFKDGKFDKGSELHRNLEYTRFKRLTGNERVKRHLKNNFTFKDYVSIFDREAGEQAPVFSDTDRFEMDCVAHEAKLLRDYISRVKEIADAQGREVLVIPNISYGYLPTSPLIEELIGAGVKVLVGAKVGSTESHNNKEVINSRLLKGRRKEVMEKQPIIIVVDGTQHLVARDEEDRAARYPDAYSGYLNQVIAMNDAMGHTEVDYSGCGKTGEDMARLRSNAEFQKLVGVYKELKKGEEKQPYAFHFWNTAGMPLIIRHQHKKIQDIEPTQPESLEGPSMVFCNVGVLDEQLPVEMKAACPGIAHMPAYYDDSGKIIAFDFGYDEHGVRYLNRLETEVKKAYNRLVGKQGIETDAELVPALIKCMELARSSRCAEGTADS
jgi:hypothetical protein